MQIFKEQKFKKILESFPVSTVVGLYRQQWWKQDQNVKTKTKIKTKTIRSRPTPRPIKQQQDYITKKNSSVATRMFVIKK